MTETTEDVWQSLTDLVGWQYHRISGGELAHILMHVISDPVRHVRTNGVYSTARVSARLVLRDDTIFAVTATADRDCMLDVLHVAAGSFAGQRFDESCFSTLDAAVAAALSASGYEATVSLERHATIFPRPLLSAGQIGRLALHAINVRRLERGEPPISHLPARLADAFAAACSFDDPAVHALRAVLAPQATAFQHSARVVHGVTLNSLAVYNFLAAPNAKCRNRVQAMEVLPWLLPMQISPGNEQMSFPVVAVRDAIDAGSALFDAVGQAFGVPREVVRWLGRRALPREWTLDAARVRRLLALLSWLPPERRPQTVEEFNALIVLGNAVIAPLGFHGDEQAAPMPGSAACMRAWLLETMRPGLVPATAAPGFAQLANELTDAKDFLRALCEAMQSFDRLDHDASVPGVLNWCASISVRRLLSLSRQWHVEVIADTSGAVAGKSWEAWPAVLTSPWQHGQLTVVELTSSAQLMAEGLAMRHCVGTYDSSCISGSSIIVSVRRVSGSPLSTAELSFRDRAAGVVLAQHRAARNAVPGAECTQAVDALLRHLNSASCLEALRARQQFQRQQADIRRLRRGHGPVDEAGFSRVAQRAARRIALGEGPA